MDQEATRIWFGFWPLALSRALAKSEDPDRTVRELELAGSYRLEEQLFSSLRFLYGSLYWPAARKAVLQRSDRLENATPDRIAREVESLAAGLAGQIGADKSLLTGVSAVALMVLEQIGSQRLQDGSGELPEKSRFSADRILRQRTRVEGRGIFGFLRTVDRRHTVVFDESRKDARFEAIHGQDVSTAAAGDPRGYRSRDPRCIQGPIPFQCRSGSCGSCWIGVLGGRERLSEISPFEKERLKYFGYDTANLDSEPHPPIRLSCQAKCYGNVSVVVPPWNGVLKKVQGPTLARPPLTTDR